MQLGEMVAIWRARRHQKRQQRHQQQHNQRRRRSDWCDCDDCDFCDCDCSPFMLGSLLSLMAISAPTRAPRAAATGPGRAGMVAIRGYQRFLSPHLPFRCRQSPSCSEFGMQAVRRYGLVVGSRLTAARIRRCNPSTPRGTFDPVP